MVSFARVPDEQIRAAHEQHHGARKDVAPPAVRNAQALVALGEYRALRWRSHAYRVPPVPFRAGARLLVAAQVIRYGGREGERALSVARAVLHELVERRRLARWRKPLRNPFRHIAASEALELIDWMLEVPDDSPPPKGEGARTIDLLHGYMDAGRIFPFCFDATTGLPHSWTHYQFAVRNVGRVLATEALNTAQSVRMAQNADKDGFATFQRKLSRVAELN